MADRLDVAARLAEGREAVEHTQAYVQACHALGFGHPDLTSHPSQVPDWYDGEDGLDLHALDQDCAALRAAGAAVTEALRMQRAQAAELAAAWQGPGGDSAVRLVQRHCDVAAGVATELRAAAQRCESLRDNLWYLVDSKVATAVAVDDRTVAQRQSWLAAAATVTGGAGDRPSAEQLIRQEVGPYVREDVVIDWLTTMRSTADAVATSYDMVIDRMAAAPTACFEFPGDLGGGYLPGPQSMPPALAPVPAAVAPAPGAPAAVAPAAVVPAPVDAASAPAAAAPVAASAAPAPAPAAPVPDWGAALGDASSLPAGDLGGGLGGLGSLGGLAGLAGRIVDAMSGLVGSATEDLGDDPFHADDEADPADDEADPADDEADPAGTAEAPSPVDAPMPATGTAPPQGVSEPAEVTPSPPPAGGEPAPAAAAADAAPPAPPADEHSTPCEIAADQLPQAGQ
ncbi:hypothetical protein [Mycobacterium parmense]|uniref:Uncharacterized protein n=1 Tax=Mycobacterium parmense TaxID=185642 RepID=A0A7I7YV35_9MYCO|nr:hypothetical protein [Mycobacterium parmense]MCV7350837.1 hypothetical protein [Mycobacterium parmense]ORW48516.1 hypothetical protein AWC20_26750 [Mycobacterium parmense]BBZ45736.1 hypothetical protein MPRM_30170 [Mycobacterium parmense]